MCKYRANEFTPAPYARKRLSVMLLCHTRCFASSAKISSEHPLLCQPDRPGSTISAKDAVRPTEQAFESSYIKKGLGSEFYIHRKRIYSVLSKKMQEQGENCTPMEQADTFNSPRIWPILATEDTEDSEKQSILDACHSCKSRNLVTVYNVNHKGH